MHSSMGDYIPVGTTTKPRWDVIKQNIEKYIRDEIIELFDFGLKIKDRNIFWAMAIQDKVTKQLAFTVMIGEWTIINYCSEGKNV